MKKFSLLSENKRDVLSFIGSMLLITLLTVTVVSASTTVSTNINTGGTLTVSGVGHLSSNLNINGGTLNLGTGSATTTLTSAAGFLGIGSTTPGVLLGVAGDINGNIIYGRYLVATSTTATSTLMGGLTVNTSTLVADYSSSHVGVGSTSPFVALGVTGTTTSSAGAILGINGSPINQVLFGTCTYNPGAVVTTSGLVTSCTGATGVTPTDKVFVTPVNLELGLVFAGASSTANNAISVMVFNATTTGGITPASKTWYWMAIK